MKKIIAVIITAIAVAGIYSCDKIDGPTREVNNSGVVIGDNAILVDGDTLSFADDTTAAVTKVLAEDYTGHLCGTCPPAGITLNDTMKSLFGSNLVVISVHAGGFADVCPTALDCPNGAPAGAFTADYRTSTGDPWMAKFGITANPIGMINRDGYPTSHKKVYTSWKSTVQNDLTNAPTMKLRIALNYNSSYREIKAAAQGSLVRDYTGTLKLQMVIVEDSIVDWQQWYSHSPQLVPDYVHHDVLRASFNGDFGDTLASASPVISGTKFIKGYFTTLAPLWNESKCKVIVFVYDADTYEVLQSEEKSFF